VVPPVTYYDVIDTDPASPTFNDSLLTAAPPVLPPGPATGQRVYNSGQPIVLKTQGAEAPFDLGGSVIVAGEPAAGDSFTLSPSSSQSVFATIAQLVGALESAITSTPKGAAKLANDVGFALTNLDQASENLLTVRARIGTRMAEIDSLANVSEDLSLQYQQTLSQLQDLDYAQAITDMQRKQLDLEAAQKSFMTTSRLSLFNYL